MKTKFRECSLPTAHSGVGLSTCHDGASCPIRICESICDHPARSMWYHDPILAPADTYHRYTGEDNLLRILFATTGSR